MKRTLVLVTVGLVVLSIAAVALATSAHPFSLTLTNTQDKAIKNATAEPVSITLTNAQVTKVKKEWPAFTGTTAMIMKAHVYAPKKVDLNFENNMLMSIEHVVTPPPGH